MKIKVSVTKKSHKEIEVEFPLYISSGDSFDNGGWYDAVIRIDEDGTEYKIRESDSGWEFSIEKISLAESLGNMLAEDQYYYSKSTAGEFYEAMEKLKGEIAKVPAALPAAKQTIK